MLLGHWGSESQQKLILLLKNTHIEIYLIILEILYGVHLKEEIKSNNFENDIMDCPEEDTSKSNSLEDRPSNAFISNDENYDIPIAGGAELCQNVCFCSGQQGMVQKSVF